MIFLDCVAAVALIAVMVVPVVVTWHMSRQHAQQRLEWTQERRELLNRVQHPERVPVEPAREFMMPDLKPDYSNLVGTVGAPREDAN